MSHLIKLCKASIVLMVLVGLIAVIGCEEEKTTEPASTPTVTEPAVAEPAPAPAPAPEPKPEVKKEPAPAETTDGWTLQYSEDFEREKLGDDWKFFSGNWDIKDGWLTITETGWGGSEIICNKKFPGAMRLEYDAKTDSDNPCDLSAVICAGPYGYESGYFIGFGSNYNSRSKLLIMGEEVTEWEAKIEKGKVHKVVAQREGNVVKHFVDGKEVMSYEDPWPLKGSGHQMFGFYVFTEGQFDNVKLYTKAEK